MQLISEHPFGDLTTRMFRMPNGLQVLLLRDDSAPIIAYQTWFNVGSRHERDGITGIAHLFEHLMFNQTKHHPPGEFDKLLERVGGDTNAATWVDWTYYRDNLPRAELELAVDLESDRMAHLVLGHKQVESEREVVANERLLRVEDDVDGFLSEELFKLAFEKHPYHWPTIGWMRDIKAITIADCEEFYRTYYAPNNATVVLVGDFEEKRALELIDKHYGSIPAQKIPDEKFEAEPEQREERRGTWPKPVSADKLRIGYKCPPMASPDFAAIEIACEALWGGNSSRLHRMLVAEKEIASSIGGGPTPFRDVGIIEIGVSMQRGHEAAEAEALVYDTLENLTLSESELQKAKTRLETRLWRELRTHGGKGEALGHYQTTLGDYRKLFEVADGYRGVTVADVSRAVKKWMSAQQRTVAIATPSGEAEAAEEEGDEE